MRLIPIARFGTVFIQTGGPTYPQASWQIGGGRGVAKGHLIKESSRMRTLENWHLKLKPAGVLPDRLLHMTRGNSACDTLENECTLVRRPRLRRCRLLAAEGSPTRRPPLATRRYFSGVLIDVTHTSCSYAGKPNSVGQFSLPSMLVYSCPIRHSSTSPNSEYD